MATTLFGSQYTYGCSTRETFTIQRMLWEVEKPATRFPGAAYLGAKIVQVRAESQTRPKHFAERSQSYAKIVQVRAKPSLLELCRAQPILCKDCASESKAKLA